MQNTSKFSLIPYRMKTNCIPQHYDTTNTPVFNDFALFTSKKRKDDNAPDDHSSKKNKMETIYEDNHEMSQEK